MCMLYCKFQKMQKREGGSEIKITTHAATGAAIFIEI